MPRYSASRTLPGPADAVWAVLADPERFADWWPGVARADPTVRRALAPGAHWRIEGSTRPSVFRRPELTGSLLVLEVTEWRLRFQLTGERAEVALELEPVEDGTRAVLVVDAPRFGGIRRTFPSRALARLAGLVRAAASG